MIFDYCGISLPSKVRSWDIWSWSDGDTRITTIPSGYSDQLILIFEDSVGDIWHVVHKKTLIRNTILGWLKHAHRTNETDLPLGTS